MPRIIDGILTNWTEADRLDLPGLGVPGVPLYGIYESGQNIFGLSSSTAIELDTTFWLNSDRDITTGRQAFGGTADTGVEFYVNFVPDPVTAVVGPFIHAADFSYRDLLRPLRSNA